MIRSLVKENLMRTSFFFLGAAIATQIYFQNQNPFDWGFLLMGTVVGSLILAVGFFVVFFVGQLLWEKFIQAIRNKIVAGAADQVKRPTGT